MKELNEQQVGFIADYLQENILKHIPLREELLDHISCAIESEMEKGKPFHLATEKVFTDFSQIELKRIETQTISSLQNNNIMTKLSLVSLFVLLFTATTMWSFTFDPPSGSPVQGKVGVTSAFGWRMHSIKKEKKMHKGVDFKLPLGTPILATSDGIVLKVEQKNTGYGNQIVIQHDESFETRYAHLSEINVEAGQTIKKGQVIALSGNSGMSLSPHLHYEVLKNGKQVDPEQYLQP